jgi:membrane protein YqaA with SNARE-associated domain
VILLACLAVGLASALFPPVNIEAYLVGLAALHGGPLLWLAVLATTVGHLTGKLLFYALGRGWLLRGMPRWLARRHALDDHLAPSPDDLAPLPGGGPGVAVVPVRAHATEAVGTGTAEPRTLRRRVAGWSGLSRVEACAGRPWATGLLCFVSAAVGLPPFAVVAVLLGRFRMPVVSFLLLGGAGRLLRFAMVAGLSGAVLG